MCTICASLNPSNTASVLDQHVDLSRLPNYSLDQIARQLTHGYWQDDGRSWRAFDLGADRTLTYDVSGLTGAERVLARTALLAWSDVSGITFEAITTPALRSHSEAGNAAAGTGTGSSMTVNSVFRGSIQSGGDEDWVRVSLRAGQTYTITLDAASSGGMNDPYLQLRDQYGNLLRSDDDGGAGLGSQITYTAWQTGTYYVTASSYSASDTGRYDLTLRSGTGNTADLTFDNNDEGAYSTSDEIGNTITGSFINIASDWDTDPVSLNSYWFQTYVHEIGHALGLGHAGNYNGDATWPTDAHYRQDSVLYSIMSYFFQSGEPGSVNPSFTGDAGYLATLMPADIVAIQNLYGQNVNAHRGHTVYGASSNITGYLGRMFGAMFENENPGRATWLDNNMVFTVYDTSGTDTLNFSTVSVAQQIRLAVGSFSSVGGYDNNMTIARGTVIERANGGRGSDLISGQSAANRLTGNAGHDTLSGAAGNDTLLGGAGNDRLNGGAGMDVASYAGASSGVRVNLGIRSAQTTGEGRDTLIGIEGLAGSARNDQLTGNGGRNMISGAAGSDRLGGAGGNDTLMGGAGNDTLSGGQGHDRMAGGGGSDTFHFTAGRDVITDFRDNVDTLALDRDLWGGNARSVGAILRFADVQGNAVVFDFGGGDTLTLLGLRSINLLANDLFSY